MKIFRILQIGILCTLFFVLLPSYSYALEITNRDSLNFDDALSESEVLYSQPKRIYITQVNSGNKSVRNDTSSWIKNIYYYSITRLKLNDIPYNYLIDASGNVFEVSRGVGANPGIEGGDNTLVIGILDSALSMTPRTEGSLVELVQQVSYRYGIKEWDFVNLNIVMSDNERSYLKAESVRTTAFQTVSQALSKVTWSDTEHLEYKASIEKVEYAKEIEIGKRLDVKVTVKNENDFPWFGDTTYIYISTKSGENSKYAINSVWESFSRATHIQDRIVKPGDTVEIPFQMMGKSRPGEYKEEFVLSKDTAFEGSSFEVLFNIIAGQNKLVEVVSPEYGFVNIRECRWYSCEKVEVANDGDVFIMTKKEEGWYEIKYNEDSLGWVYQKYIKEL
jgi:hypothetical protein